MSEQREPTLRHTQLNEGYRVFESREVLLVIMSSGTVCGSGA